MKKFYPLSPTAIIALFFSFFLSITSFAQEVIYYENFSGGIPDDYTIIDVDGLTVARQLDSTSIPDLPFNGSWVTQINFFDGTDTVAASSSWYDPAGASNDWLITPQISIPDTSEFFLQWRAVVGSGNFADGYEVYISTTGNTIPDFTNRVFSKDEEITQWATRLVSLADFAGEDIYIGFRNNSDDKLILLLDDIYIAEAEATVTVDPAILFTEFPDIYPIAPIGQLDTFFLSATATNLGNAPIQDTFEIDAVIFDPFPNNPIFGQSLEGPTTPFDTFEVARFEGNPAFIPVDTGLHVIGYLINSVEENAYPENDFTNEAFSNNLSFETVDVSDSVLARDDGAISTSIPQWTIPSSIFGPNHRSIGGSVFFLNKADILTSMTAFFVAEEDNIGDVLFCQIYNDSLQLIAQSESYTILAEDTAVVSGINFSFAQGRVNKQAAAEGVDLNAGAYIFALQGGTSLRVVMTDNIFLEGGTFFSSDSLAAQNAWFTTEELKPFIDSALVQQGGAPNWDERRVFALRANLAGCGSLGGELVITNDDGSSNGSVALIPSGGQAPYSYAWSDSGPRPETDSLITGLTQGRYSVTLTDAEGCASDFFATVSLGTSTLDPIDIGFTRFQAYPNPTTQALTVDMTLEGPDQVRLSLLDIQGRELVSRNFDNQLSFDTKIKTENWPSGIYLLQVQTSRGMIHKRIMVQ